MGILSTSLCGIELDNPIIPASGTFGYGYEYADIYDINLLGSISIKGTTSLARFGNNTPRIAESYEGIINSVGLQNPGVDAVIAEELTKLKKVYKKAVIANVGGFSEKEYVENCKKFDECEQIGWLEVNISCPNVHGGGMSFGTSAEMAAQITKAVKSECKKPVIMKLSPNVTNIAEIAKACENAGADGLCLINTISAMRIDLKTKRPILANIMGGLSGPAVFPIALRMVYQVYEAVDIPIIGVGGISTAEDVLEMILAGATAVEIGASNLVNPSICKDIIKKLPDTMKKFGFLNINEIIGGTHNG